MLTLWRGVAIGFSLRDEGRDYLSGVRPDTAEAEAERQANRKNYERWLTVFSHPATRHAGRERVHKAVNLLAETNKTPQEILWFLMGEKPFLLGKSA